MQYFVAVIQPHKLEEVKRLLRTWTFASDSRQGRKNDSAILHVF